MIVINDYLAFGITVIRVYFIWLAVCMSVYCENFRDTIVDVACQHTINDDLMMLCVFVRTYVYMALFV